MAFVTFFVAAFAVTPTLCFVLRIEAEMEQGVVVLAGHHDNIAAVASVPAAGAASGNVFFAPESQAAVAAIAALHQDIYFIDKQHLRIASQKTLMASEHAHLTGQREFYSAGAMLTNLPMRPRSRNSMTPLIFAKSVSSLPRPTLVPGRMRVPRCRTMMEPPGTNWPPKAFMPNRCALESRPFFELPNPFYVP